MRELQLNQVEVYALLVRQSARHCSKAVRRHFIARIAKATDCAIQRIFADRTAPAAGRGENVPLTSRNRHQRLQNVYRLLCERNDMRLAPSSFGTPESSTEVITVQHKLQPLGSTQLTRSYEHVRSEL